MEVLAIELQHRIYQLACTDGGFTGCSLSLVSRHVRTTSRPVRFYSVSLTKGTASQLASFLACYMQERATAADGETDSACPIRHLSMVVGHEKTREDDWEQQLYASTREDPERTPGEKSQEQHDYIGRVRALFHLAAPYVRTLSLVQSQRSLELPNIETPEGFLMLEELTLVRGHPPIEGHPFGGPKTLYPRLNRLHIDFRNSHHTIHTAQWAERAPNLTHLRLSDVSRISEELDQLVVRENPPLKNLVRLFIQPREPPPPGGFCGNPYIEHAEFMTELAKLQHASQRLPVEILPYRDFETAESETEEHLRNALLGGEGAFILGGDAMKGTIEGFLEWDRQVEEKRKEERQQWLPRWLRIL